MEIICSHSQVDLEVAHTIGGISTVSDRAEVLMHQVSETDVFAESVFSPTSTSALKDATLMDMSSNPVEVLGLLPSSETNKSVYIHKINSLGIGLTESKFVPYTYS